MEGLVYEFYLNYTTWEFTSEVHQNSASGAEKACLTSWKANSELTGTIYRNAHQTSSTSQPGRICRHLGQFALVEFKPMQRHRHPYQPKGNTIYSNSDSTRSAHHCPLIHAKHTPQKYSSQSNSATSISLQQPKK